jgi:hypothetical protein
VTVPTPTISQAARLCEEVLGSSACQTMSTTCCSLSEATLAEQAVSAKIRQANKVKDREGNRIFHLSLAPSTPRPTPSGLRIPPPGNPSQGAWSS